MAKSKKICTACGEEKAPIKDFYVSRSKLYKFNDGRMPICKECLMNLFRDLNVKYYNGKFDAYQRTYIIESENKDVLSVPYL